MKIEDCERIADNSTTDGEWDIRDSILHYGERCASRAALEALEWIEQLLLDSRILSWEEFAEKYGTGPDGTTTDVIQKAIADLKEKP